MARRQLLKGYNTKKKRFPREIYLHLIGERHNHLIVNDIVYKKGIVKGKETQEFLVLECKCDCGNIVYIRPYQFVRGEYSSCGCSKKNGEYFTNFSHRLSGEKLYKVWNTMRRRCYVPTDKKYKSYGARGIIVCDEWLNDYMVFREWAMSNGYKENLSLDRIDNDGNYEPNNCRWTTRSVQQRNRRNCKQITYHGKTQCLADWCDELKLDYKTIDNRLLNGWEVERTFETPIIHRKKNC